MVRSTLARGHLRAVPSAGEQAHAPSDRELVDAMQRGDARVAAEIYERLIGVVERTLYRILGRRGPDHHDLVQATFEQIVITLSTGRYAGACSLQTWAAALATHVGLKALRTRLSQVRPAHRLR